MRLMPLFKMQMVVTILAKKKPKRWMSSSNWLTTLTSKSKSLKVNPSGRACSADSLKHSSEVEMARRPGAKKMANKSCSRRLKSASRFRSMRQSKFLMH